MRKIIKFLDDYFEEAIMVVLLALISVIILLQVFFRYVLHSALAWPEEFSRYCFIYSSFLSLGYCIKHDRLLKVDVIVELLPKSLNKFFKIFNQVVMFVLFAYLFYFSLDVVRSAFVSQQVSTALYFPMYLLYCCLPMGFFLGMFRIIENFVKVLFCRKKEGEEK